VHSQSARCPHVADIGKADLLGSLLQCVVEAMVNNCSQRTCAGVQHRCRTAISFLALAAFAADVGATDGYFDSTWAGGGRIVFAGDVHNPNRETQVLQVVPQSNGNLLLGGDVDPGGFDYWWLGELLSDGTHAPAFGEGNGLTTSCHLSVGLCSGNGLSAFALLSDGRIQVTDDKTLTRTSAEAKALDTAGVFGGTGSVNLAVPIDNVQGSMTYGYAIARTSSGGWIVAGEGFYSTATSGNSDFAAIRLNANLSLDASFNNTGGFSGGQLVAFDGGGGNTDAARVAIVQSDGRIVLAGYASPGGEAAFARLNANGTLDSTFGGGGTGTMILSGLDGRAFTPHSVKVGPAGRLLVATRLANGVVELVPHLFVVRLTPDGIPDSGLGTSGTFEVPVPSTCTGGAAVNAVAVDSAGRILMSGFCDVTGSGKVFLVARLNGQDGSLDTNFGIDGFSYGTFDALSTSDEASDIVIDGSGHPIVVGVSQPTGATRKAGVARLTYDLIFTSDFEATPRGYLPGQ
jgi:uncharacterized delta-60 repeat protein